MNDQTIDISGLLPVNKPSGMSSFDVIRVFKKSTQFKGKIGHAGTLDVFAEGLLILMLGKATKQFDELQKRDKVYQAGVRLGYSSDTLDVEGQLTKQEKDYRPTLAQVVATAEGMEGKQEQEVPKYSAAKQNGQPLYKLARQGKKIIPKTKSVEVFDINVTAYKFPLATIDVRCSSGTYIRQLTADIFNQLELDSFLFKLQRTRIGNIYLQQAASLEDIKNQRWLEHVLETG